MGREEHVRRRQHTMLGNQDQIERHDICERHGYARGPNCLSVTNREQHPVNAPDEPQEQDDTEDPEESLELQVLGPKQHPDCHGGPGGQGQQSRQAHDRQDPHRLSHLPVKHRPGCMAQLGQSWRQDRIHHRQGHSGPDHQAHRRLVERHVRE